MYSSNTNNIDANSILTDEGFSSSSLLNYFPPSPLINYDDASVFYQYLYDIVHQNGDQEAVTHDKSTDSNIIKITDDKFCSESSTGKKKSSCGEADNHSQQIRINRCKKDRHSKIITANGSSRGRRMRLSIDVAKDFFALQDMLEYDKASQTVEWLIMKSEGAIKDLKKNLVIGTKGTSTPSSTLVTSAIDELEDEVKKKEKMIRVKGSQKLAAPHIFTRESRDKTRARARERTQEKKRLQLADDQSKLYNISQEMNSGSHYNPLLGCIKSSEAGNNILYMNPSDPASVLEKSLNCSKQQSLNFEGSTMIEELIGDSFFIAQNWNPNI